MSCCCCCCGGGSDEFVGHADLNTHALLGENQAPAAEFEEVTGGCCGGCTEGMADCCNGCDDNCDGCDFDIS